MPPQYREESATFLLFASAKVRHERGLPPFIGIPASGCPARRSRAAAQLSNKRLPNKTRIHSEFHAKQRSAGFHLLQLLVYLIFASDDYDH